MAIITNTATTFSGNPGLAGLREDLSDIIYNLSPTETPFLNGVGRTTAKQTLHEWQTDTLAAADNTNAQIQGDDITSFAAASITTRLGNRTQISRKTVIIDGTVEVVNKAGRKSELAYQMAKRGKELKLDIEAILLANQAKVTGNSTTAPTLGSVLSFVKTNVDKDAGGTNPTGDGSNTRTDSGTTRTLTEAMVKNVQKLVYTNSGNEPDILMVGPANRQVVSTFAGNSTRMVEADSRKLIAAIDVYVGDFGTLRVMPNRFQRTRDAHVVNYELWAVAWLRPIRMVELAKTGDAEKRMLIGEYTLEARNEAGSGLIADLA